MAAKGIIPDGPNSRIGQYLCRRNDSDVDGSRLARFYGGRIQCSDSRGSERICKWQIASCVFCCTKSFLHQKTACPQGGGNTSEVGVSRQAAPPRTNRNFQQPARRQPHPKNFDYGEKQTDPQRSRGTSRENRYRFALCHGAIQRYGTRPISDNVRAIGAVVEGGFYQGTGLRRRVPSDKKLTAERWNT